MGDRSLVVNGLGMYRILEIGESHKKSGSRQEKSRDTNCKQAMQKMATLSILQPKLMCTDRNNCFIRLRMNGIRLTHGRSSFLLSYTLRLSSGRCISDELGDLRMVRIGFKYPCVYFVPCQ